uniref:G_PROTEIN_RECEP_F1_2 domain-containing protein n=1 Tax=Steinernema glaseri TaxID=37863 RepID=A0A1I7ZTE2_9BILA
MLTLESVAFVAVENKKFFFKLCLSVGSPRTKRTLAPLLIVLVTFLICVSCRENEMLSAAEIVCYALYVLVGTGLLLVNAPLLFSFLVQPTLRHQYPVILGQNLVDSICATILVFLGIYVFSSEHICLAVIISTGLPLFQTIYCLSWVISCMISFHLPVFFRNNAFTFYVFLFSGALIFTLCVIAGVIAVEWGFVTAVECHARRAILFIYIFCELVGLTAASLHVWFYCHLQRINYKNQLKTRFPFFLCIVSFPIAVLAVVELTAPNSNQTYLTVGFTNVATCSLLFHTVRYYFDAHFKKALRYTFIERSVLMSL